MPFDRFLEQLKHSKRETHFDCNEAQYSLKSSYHFMHTSGKCLLQIIKPHWRYEEVMSMTRIRSLCTVSCMLLAVIFSTHMLSSCKKKPFELKNPAVVGKWEGVDQTAELFRDGKIILGTDWKSKQSMGRYEFIDEDTIRVRFKSSRPQDYKISLTGSSLKVTRADGTFVGEFKRVNQPQQAEEG